MRNRIIAVIFLCFLLFFGVRTGMNVWDSISDTEKENQKDLLYPSKYRV